MKWEIIPLKLVYSEWDPEDKATTHRTTVVRMYI